MARMIRLVVLGAGTCALSPTRGCSGYWVEVGGLRIRLDSGPGSVHAMARFGLPWTGVTHQVITHFHLDHVHDLPTLLFSLKYGRADHRADPLTIIGPKGIEALTQGYVGLYRMRLLAQEFPVQFREVEPPATLRFADVAMRFVKTPHTGESVAVRIDCGGASLGYTGDTSPSDEVVELFRGVDLLLSECSFIEGQGEAPHLTADQTAQLAQAAGAKHLLATHAYFDPEKERLAQRLQRIYKGEITLPRDGEAFVLGASGTSRTRPARTRRR